MTSIAPSIPVLSPAMVEQARSISAQQDISLLMAVQQVSGWESEMLMAAVAECFGYTLITMPPPSSGGVALLEMLKILEGWDLRAIGRTPRAMHLIAEAMKRKPKKRTYDGTATLNVVLADWQIGKNDGDGVEGTIQRVLDCRDAVIVRARELRKIGRPVAHLNVLWTGDSVECCVRQYATQR